jgi:O-antigen chain-terminating methyltransferase
MPILDLGCGRGEWLELLAEQGWHARGLDSNRVMVEECRQRGLAVSEGDVLAHLRSLPDASLGAVTAFHVLEHLPLEVLLRFLDETARVLRPGGIAIFETPNPENLVVGGCDFYRDPTHQRPLHPDTVQFLVEQRGLVRVEILRLSEHRIQDPLQLLPWHHSLAAYLNPLIDRAKRHFFGPTDYAVIGRKAGEAQALR